MPKLQYIFFKIIYNYLKIQLLKHTLDLNNDKNPSKIKKKKRDEKKIILLTFPWKLNVLFIQTSKTGLITECQEVTR